MCLHIHVCACVCTHVHVETRCWQQMPSSITPFFLFCFSLKNLQTFSYKSIRFLFFSTVAYLRKSLLLLYFWSRILHFWLGFVLFLRVEIFHFVLFLLCGFWRGALEVTWPPSSVGKVAFWFLLSSFASLCLIFGSLPVTCLHLSMLVFILLSVLWTLNCHHNSSCLLPSVDLWHFLFISCLLLTMSTCFSVICFSYQHS